MTTTESTTQDRLYRIVFRTPQLTWRSRPLTTTELRNALDCNRAKRARGCWKLGLPIAVEPAFSS